MNGENVDQDRPSDHSIQRARRVRCGIVSANPCSAPAGQAHRRRAGPGARRHALPEPGSAETVWGLRASSSASQRRASHGNGPPSVDENL